MGRFPRRLSGGEPGRELGGEPGGLAGREVGRLVGRGAGGLPRGEAGGVPRRDVGGAVGLTRPGGVGGVGRGGVLGRDSRRGGRRRRGGGRRRHRRRRPPRILLHARGRRGGGEGRLPVGVLLQRRLHVQVGRVQIVVLPGVQRVGGVHLHEAHAHHLLHFVFLLLLLRLALPVHQLDEADARGEVATGGHQPGLVGVQGEQLVQDFLVLRQRLLLELGLRLQVRHGADGQGRQEGGQDGYF